ncbi:MAG: preprotein translocase subunit SecY, partial [Candidatus Omnitrophica bacterium]|nr:preprotein translocase subunit SecY [Candidatus Omnitrophota bacterium]MCA9445685.1 preprotein translocase subunit SecY [Candidatus Omnitrophota bacterium]
RYSTVVITFAQASMLLVSFQNQQGPSGDTVAYSPGLAFLLQGALAMTTGTILVMWMGEQITQQGIGNGISLIIFANIIARFPEAATSIGMLVRNGRISMVIILMMFAVMIAVIAFIVLLTYGQRRISIRKGKQQVGRRMMQAGGTSYLPLKINTAGVIPIIFASSLMIFPSTIFQIVGPILPEGMSIWMESFISQYWVPGNSIYIFFEFFLILFFCYFYTAVVFNPKDIAENLQKNGVAIPGYKQGAKTEEYLDSILTRITLAGAVMLALVAILPQIFIRVTGLPFMVSQFLGGTSLIIVVGVALDTVNQIENHLRVRNYEGFRAGSTGSSRRRRF